MSQSEWVQGSVCRVEYDDPDAVYADSFSDDGHIDDAEQAFLNCYESI